MQYRQILAATDLTELGTQAASAAVALADQLHAPHVRLVHAVNPVGLYGGPIPEMVPGILAGELQQEAIQHASAELARLAIPATEAEVTREIRCGIPVQEIVSAASAARADLIVVATHGRGPLGRILFGSVASNLIRMAPCPVLAVGVERRLAKPVRSVLAAVDLSTVTLDVLESALALLGPAASPPIEDGGNWGHLHVLLNLADPPLRGERALARAAALPSLDSIANRARARIGQLLSGCVVPRGVEVSVEIRAANPRTDILRHAEEKHVDVIAVGTSGHNAFARALLGSTATYILAEAACPVLAVPRTQRI